MTTSECMQAEQPRNGVSVDFGRGDPKVSPNKRSLENRRQKGFTVIQAVALAELDGLNDRNVMRPQAAPGQ